MKTLSLFLGMLLVANCMPPPVKFISVTPRTEIPDGAREIVMIGVTPEQIKGALQANGIFYITAESGLQTEEFLIDDCTRGKFVITQFSEAIKIVPYWGVTEKVRNQIQFATIITTGMGNPYTSNDMERVIYKRVDGSRPRMVFDYAAQVFSGIGQMQYK